MRVGHGMQRGAAMFLVVSAGSGGDPRGDAPVREPRYCAGKLRLTRRHPEHDGGNDGPAAVVVVAPAEDAPEVRSEAARLARELKLPLARSLDELERDSLALTVTGRGLELREGSARGRAALVVDFAEIDLRRGSGNLSRRQPLVRAFGSKAHTITDTTAGLGHDAFLLACCGFEVTAIERNPIVFELLRDGLRRAQEDPRFAKALGGRLQVIRGDARAALAEGDDRPHAVFIDPMFPPKRKRSALAKKSIRIVRRLVGDDPDAAELLEAALAAARDRVVVKRPTHAAPLRAEPSLTFESKLVRYDVYLAGRGPRE